MRTQVFRGFVLALALTVTVAAPVWAGAVGPGKGSHRPPYSVAHSGTRDGGVGGRVAVAEAVPNQPKGLVRTRAAVDILGAGNWALAWAITGVPYTTPNYDGNLQVTAKFRVYSLEYTFGVGGGYAVNDLVIAAWLDGEDPGNAQYCRRNVGWSASFPLPSEWLELLVSLNELWDRAQQLVQGPQAREMTFTCNIEVRTYGAPLDLRIAAGTRSDVLNVIGITAAAFATAYVQELKIEYYGGFGCNPKIGCPW